jgi:Family of unknown function (DUF6481)
MKQSIVAGFADRRKSAADAKKELLNKFKSAPKADDPVMIAKRLEREKIAAAREERRLERERVKQEKLAAKKAEEEAARLAEEALKAEAEAKAREEAEARALGQKKLIEQVVADEAARKAERDRRYAARKARQRK